MLVRDLISFRRRSFFHGVLFIFPLRDHRQQKLPARLFDGDADFIFLVGICALDDPHP
jgi:hypothetical protein